MNSLSESSRNFTEYVLIVKRSIILQNCLICIFQPPVIAVILSPFCVEELFIDCKIGKFSFFWKNEWNLRRDKMMVRILIGNVLRRESNRLNLLH